MTAKAKIKPFKPVPVAVQQQRKRQAIRALRKQKIIPVAAQRRQHQQAQKAASAGGRFAFIRTMPQAKKHGKARGWSPDETLPVCSARAVAEALRLASGTILSGDDVLAIYWSAASDGDSGISILDALTAAQTLMPGFPVWRDLVIFPLCPAGSDASDGASFGGLFPGCGQLLGSVPRPGDLSPLILGLSLPEPHAVVQHDGAWWSWGQPYQPWPDAVVEEAWEVQWLP